VDLNAQNSRLKYYNETLFFTAQLPLFDVPGTDGQAQAVSQGAERDAYVVLQPLDVSGNAMPPVTVHTFTCSEYVARAACGALASPPPPGNWTRTAAAAAGGGRRRGLLRRLLAHIATSRSAAVVADAQFVPGTASAASWGNMWSAADAATAAAAAAAQAQPGAQPQAAAAAAQPAQQPGAPPPPPQVSSSDGAAAPAPSAGWDQWTSAGASPAAGAPQCTAYFRQITFLSSLQLVASLSGTNASWVLSQPSACGASYSTATLPVSKAVYEQDMFAPVGDFNASSPFVPMRWCQLWPQHFSAPNQQPTVTVRGAGDPYLVAQEVTKCSLQFPGAAPSGSALAPLSGVGILANRAEDALLVAFVTLSLAACAVGAVNSMRPAAKTASFTTLLRDSPRGPGSPASPGYYGAAAAAPAARGGDVEVTTWLRAAKGGAAESKAEEGQL